MSHLWIDQLCKRFEPAHSVGIAIGRQQIGLVRVRRSGQEIESITELPLPAPLFSGLPTLEAISGLGEALTELGRDLDREYLPVHVSLPDAAVRLAIYELDALPKTRVEQQELARWRLQQEGGGVSVTAASQDLGPIGEQHLLLALSMSAEWQAAIQTALVASGITAWSLSADCCRQYNRFYNRLAADSGALINFTPDSWSLLLWDSDGRVRYGRARWRNSGDALAEIAAEVERAILAYLHSDTGRTVARVHILNAAADEALAIALDERLREPCTRLQPLEDLVAGADLDPGRVTFPAAAAAALEA